HRAGAAEIGDGDALAVPDGDQPRLLEHAHGLAQRVAVRLVALRELALAGQALAGRELTAQDLPADVAEDRRGDVGRAARLGLGGHGPTLAVPLCTVEMGA